MRSACACRGIGAVRLRQQEPDARDDVCAVICGSCNADPGGGRNPERGADSIADANPDALARAGDSHAAGDPASQSGCGGYF